MREEIVVALCDAVVKKHLEGNPIQGIRGPRGIRGLKGESGKNFSLSENEEILKPLIAEEIKEKLTNFKREFSELTDEQISSLKLKFEDLTDSEKDSLRGARGKTGQSGKSFSFDRERESISLIIENYISKISSTFKLKFEDLSEEDKNSLKGEVGPKGPRGQKGPRGLSGEDGKDGVDGKVGPVGPRGSRGEKGKAGRNFILEHHKVEIDNTIIDYFEKIKNQLKLNFDDLTFENKEELKLKFESLTNEEKEKLRGVKGPRGQKGSLGKRGLSAFEVWREINNGSEEDFFLSLRGQRGIDGLDGVDGKNGSDGFNGKDGKSGINGKDAPFVIDVIANNYKNNNFTLEFEYSDGTVIRTNRIKLPISSIVNQMLVSGGGGGSSLEISQEGSLLGKVSSIDFSDDFEIEYDEENKLLSIANDSKILVLDEGDTVSDQTKVFNFIGDGVTVRASDAIGNWKNLSDIETLDEIIKDPWIIDVIVESSNRAEFYESKVAGEDIVLGDAVVLVSKDTVGLVDLSSYNSSVIFGVAMEDAISGDSLKISVLGFFDDSSFLFSLNSPLYVGADSKISTVKHSVSSEYSVKIGKSNGVGSIYVNIGDPELID